MLTGNFNPAGVTDYTIQELRVAMSDKMAAQAELILQKKIQAKPEDFNGRAMPQDHIQQAAYLFREALLINNQCETATYHLGVMAFFYKLEVRVSDNLPWLIGSKNHALISASFYRLTLKINPYNAFACTELAMLITEHNVIAEKNDFLDKIVPVSPVEQAAKLLRHARLSDFYYPRAIFQLAFLIEKNSVIACQADFAVDEYPNDYLLQAALLYRLSLTNTFSQPWASERLASLILQERVGAIASDFPTITMPATVPEQAAVLLRGFLQEVNKECLLSRYTMAGLIAGKKIAVIEQDYDLFGFTATASAEEQAAVVYRKIIADKENKCNKPELYYLAVLELAELILANKVVKNKQDHPSFDLEYTKIIDHVNCMVLAIPAIVGVADKLKDLLARIAVQAKKELLASFGKVGEDRLPEKGAENSHLETLASAVKALDEETRPMSNKRPSLVTIKSTSTNLGVFAQPSNKKQCNMQTSNDSSKSVATQTIGIGSKNR